MRSINVNVRMYDLTQPKRVVAAINKKMGKDVSMYIQTYCSALNLGMQMSNALGQSAVDALGEAFTANFIAAMIVMKAPEGSDEAVRCLLQTSAKVNEHIGKWATDLENAGAHPEEVGASEQQLHAYLEKHLDLSEEIAIVENM